MRRTSLFRAMLVLLFTCAAIQPLRAQILYKVNFHDKNNGAYEGLLVYFNESRSYMRIGYYTTGNKYNVVNVDYKSFTGTYYDGSSYFYMSGSNPKFITANPDKNTYNPDYFIWRKSVSEINWKQPSTSDDPNLNAANELPVDSFYQVNPYTVTETFLRKFFWNNESEYFALKKLCGLTATTTTTPVTTNSAKLHLVVIANTLIGDIGPSCSADRDKLDYEFRSIADALGAGYAKYIVDGDNFNKATVQSTLNNLRVGNNDIIVFFYRGHGFRWDNQTDIYPNMDLRKTNYLPIDKTTSMPLLEVYNTLKNKGARLSLVLADCCNNKVGINQSTSVSFLNSQSDNKPDVSKLKRLFMTSRGTLISAAARSGEYSWANPFGGFYTLSFIQAMKEKISYLNNGTYSWNDIITYTTRLAKDKSSPALCSNCTLQTGVSYVNVSY